VKLEHLALNIMKNDKMSSEAIIKHLASGYDEDIDCQQEYKDLYEAAYGERITKELAEEWVKAMKVTDGSDRMNGQKWTSEQTYEVGSKIGIDWNVCSKTDFYIVMNMMYSDNYKTAKSVGLSEDPIFFARLAKDWLCDEDAGKNKLYNYYFNVIV